MAVKSFRDIDRTGIVEERGFTNPHVRFIRRNGKIIPIVNRKRIGQDLSQTGRTTMKYGAIAGTAGLAKKTKIFKKTSTLIKKVPKFNFKPNFMKLNKSSSFKKKAAVKTFNALKGVTKFGAKNVGKLGLAGMAVGAATLFAGDELQLRYKFGKDFFFTRDEHGRKS